MAYLPNSDADRRAMLEAIGVDSIDDLFASIPSAVRLKRPLDLPPPQTEMELEHRLGGLAGRNTTVRDAVCFLGGGAYDHFIPSVVDTIAGRGEFYTAYTPYQAEASQGSLQAFFEYQTMICQLTGMDVSNASLYEGGSAVAESVVMAMSIHRNRRQVLVAESVHPEYRQVLATYATNLDLKITTIPTPEGWLDPDEVARHASDDLLCVIVQHPNFFGFLEEVDAIAKLCHDRGGLFVVSFDPISLGMLKRPGDYGADIAVAEGQCLGIPLGYGGPYLGILTCRQEFVRKMPGRLVGQTVDRNGKRCWVLTLQTREQHIRREKATSNICTNQGLMALRAAAYLAALGPEGLRATAELCCRKAHYAAEQLTTLPGVALLAERPFFKEFSIRLPCDARAVLERLREEGLLGGLALGRWYPDLPNAVSIAVTEKRTREEIDRLVSAIRNHLN